MMSRRSFFLHQVLSTLRGILLIISITSSCSIIALHTNQGLLPFAFTCAHILNNLMMKYLAYQNGIMSTQFLMLQQPILALFFYVFAVILNPCTKYG